MEVLLNQINTRQRSGGAGAADFASSPAVENATKFIRSSKITSEAMSSALDSVAKNVEAAQSKVTNSMAFTLEQYVGGVVHDIATWYVKRNSPPPLSENDRLGFAIAQFRGKYPDKYPAPGEYKNLREQDPKMFAAVLTILKGSTSGNTIACSADIEDFKKTPTMVKAQAIIDKYIVDPNIEDSFENKPHQINIYELQYQKFLANYESVKLALADKAPDAQERLVNVFEPIRHALVEAERGLNSNIRTEIAKFGSEDRGKVTSYSSPFA